MKELLKPDDAGKLSKTGDNLPVEKNVNKEKLEQLLDLIESTLSVKAAFPVLKIGMIYLIPLLNSYKRLYNKFTELLVAIPE